MSSTLVKLRRYKASLVVTKHNQQQFKKLLLDGGGIGWYWPGASYNGNITLEHILEHPELPWNKSSLISNTFDGKINKLTGKR